MRLSLQKLKPPKLKMDQATDTKLAVHEAICSERYNSIDRSLRDGDKRMTKIEYLLYGVIVCVLFGPGVAGELVKKILGL
jgi:hypothetical protein